jgi:hypothetical protein
VTGEGVAPRLDAATGGSPTEPEDLLAQRGERTEPDAFTPLAPGAWARMPVGAAA